MTRWDTPYPSWATLFQFDVKTVDVKTVDAKSIDAKSTDGKRADAPPPGDAKRGESAPLDSSASERGGTLPDQSPAGEASARARLDGGCGCGFAAAGPDAGALLVLMLALAARLLRRRGLAS